ncbi:MAG: M14 metallopeptidase family protein [Candidatus Neomarinimicrobiota bacterium]
MTCRALLLVPVLMTALWADAPIRDWIPGTDYDPAIPTYTESLGYTPGEALTTHREMLRYLQTLAAASDKVIMRTYGRSYQGRDLVTVVISSLEHMARLDQIVADLQVLTDPRRSAERDRILEQTPAVVYLAYSVHGDEHSTTEAALLTAYHLASDLSEQTRKVLDNTVVVIDPLQNPDGRMRFISFWENTQALPSNPDPNAVEHNQGWISGRTNHYLFDLNRDWFPLTQRESQDKIKEVLYWNPQVLVDFHEMGYQATYYFPPPAEAINRNIPAQTLSWWEVFGRANARAFDARGWTYFTQEVFDAFYPGYGDSWPAFNGAVGMTYEQASSEGQEIERPDGTILTLKEAIQHHFVSGVTTVATAADNRRQLLRDFSRHFQKGMDQGSSGEVREYILPVSPESRVNLDLAAVLQQLGIEIRQAQESFSNRQLATFRGQSLSRKTFNKGTLIIPTAQPRYVLLKALIEPDTPMDEAFIKEELQRHKERLPDRIYDVTAWSLPFAYDATVYLAGEPSKVKTRPYDASVGISAPGRLTADTENIYAYLIPYTSHHALAALARLWREGVKVHISREPFSQNGRSFPRGSLVVFPANNGPELPQVMDQVAQTYPLDIVATTTGWMDKGVNLGSMNVVFLKQPKVLLLFPDRPVSAYSYGATAWLMEQVYGLPFTSLWPAQLRQLDLYEYDVLVLPHAWGNYRDALGDELMIKVKAWLQAGGTVIGLKGGAAFLTGAELELTSVVLVDDVRPEEQTREKIKKRREEKEQIAYEFRPKAIPGAIFEVHLNGYHYLTYGYDDNTYVHIQSSYIFLPSEDGINVAVFPEGGGMVSGFAWDGADAQLSDKVYLVDEHVGNGHVILFADDPNFRGYWRGLSKLFMNAVMLSLSLNR